MNRIGTDPGCLSVFPLVTFKEKLLYHQIHPFKLSVDIGTSLVGLYPLWRHELVPALAIMIPPAVISAILVVAFANLEPMKDSRLGRYVAHHMTRAAEAQRMLGMCVVASGAWNHSLNELAIGLGVILVVFPLSDTALVS